MGLALVGTGTAALAAACRGRHVANPASSAGAAKTGQPRSGGTLKLAEFNDFFDFDPTIQGSAIPNSSSRPSNRTGVQDSRLDALILAQRREVDPAKRTELIRQASVYIAENAYDVPVHATAVWNFWQPYLKNYSAHWVQTDYDARDVWLDK